MKFIHFFDHPWIHTMILGLFSLLIAFNLFQLSFKTIDQYKKLEQATLEPGFEFAGLKEHLQNISQAGFISDKDQTAEGNDGKFMLAQYMLAPTALDLNNPNHRYIILDCTTPQAAAYLLKITNANPIAITPFGKILAERQL